MHELDLSADDLVESLLNLPSELNLCLLDSCGVSHLNSHFLIAGISPIERVELNETDPEKTLESLKKKLSQNDLSAFLTISYDFGLKLNNIKSKHKNTVEPDIFLALFDVLIIHDYNFSKTYLKGNSKRFAEIEEFINTSQTSQISQSFSASKISSNFDKESYISAIEEIQQLIRCGDTYQTNLTQQIRAELPENLNSELIFQLLRKNHPAPFASFIRRKNDVVISASPERFFKVEGKNISTSPIKGTRPRGKTTVEDSLLKNELINSEKDRAENTMIVDLLRNDLGRICEFGTIKVEKLCDLEQHPTLFHLVSTVTGTLKPKTNLTEILRNTFPCGSITGAPKIRTMQIIDRIEPNSRGLSMGAIGFVECGIGIYLQEKTTQNQQVSNTTYIDLSVAIRTMTIRGQEAIFNVGGGIVIDSIPENEYEETLTKAKALLNSIGGKIF